MKLTKVWLLLFELTAEYLIPNLSFLVSVLALNEFTDIKKKLEVEEANRKTAEDVASEVFINLKLKLENL